MKIKITAESTLDMNEEQLAQFGITKIPLTVQLGDETHTDGVDLDAEGIFSYVAKTGILPKTCAVPPVQFEDFFREQLDAGYDAVIHFCHWGCKQTLGASAMAKEAFEQAGFPTLVLDGDGCDTRNVQDGQMMTRMGAFLEQLEALR